MQKKKKKREREREREREIVWEKRQRESSPMKETVWSAQFSKLYRAFTSYCLGLGLSLYPAWKVGWEDGAKN